METNQPIGTTKKPIFKKWWFWAICIVILIVIGSAGSKKSVRSSDAATTSETSSSDGLTMAGFNRIKDGMSKSEVDKIAGSSGEVQSSAGSGAQKIEMYKYSGTDGDLSFSIIGYTNDRVTNKTQVGLK